MNLTEKLITLRMQKGLTQIDLAEKLNVSRQAISRWEVGTSVPSIDNLKVLSELYGVSLDYLLCDEADSFVSAKSQEQTPKEQNRGIKITGHMVILMGIMVVSIIVMILVILQGATRIYGSNQPEEVSITDLNCDQNPKDYPEETFQLIPMD